MNDLEALACGWNLMERATCCWEWDLFAQGRGKERRAIKWGF